MRPAPAILALGLFVLLQPAGAKSAGTVIPLPDEDRKALSLLGDGVMGKALPAEPLSDFTKTLGLGPGEWKFQITSGDDKGKTQVETYTNLGKDGSKERWRRTIGKEYWEFFETNPGSALVKTAETDLEFGYQSGFDPPFVVHPAIPPGESVTSESKLEVSTQKNPKDIKYTGTAKAKLTYVGAYEVHTPAGSFPSMLIRTDYEIHVGPAKVSDVSYMLFSEGVGKVAEIEALRVSAVLVYHSDTKVGKVLTSHPGM